MVLELSLRSFNANLVPDFEQRDVLRDIALLVCLGRGDRYERQDRILTRLNNYLDQQVKVTQIIVAACWCVRPHDALSVDFCLDRNMLTDGKAENVICVRQTEAISRMVLLKTTDTRRSMFNTQCSIGRYSELRNKRELLPFLRFEDRLFLYENVSRSIAKQATENVRRLTSFVRMNTTDKRPAATATWALLSILTASTAAEKDNILGEGSLPRSLFSRPMRMMSLMSQPRALSCAEMKEVRK